MSQVRHDLGTAPPMSGSPKSAVAGKWARQISRTAAGLVPFRLYRFWLFNEFSIVRASAGLSFGAAFSGIFINQNEFVDKAPEGASHHRNCERGRDILTCQQRCQLPGTDSPVFSQAGLAVAHRGSGGPGPDWLVGAREGRDGPESENVRRVADHFERRC